MSTCGRCGLPVSPGICAPKPHVFHTRPEDCIRDLRAHTEKLEAVVSTARHRVACTIYGGPEWTDADDDAMQDAVDALDGKEYT
jgi:hypothetical protein